VFSRKVAACRSSLVQALFAGVDGGVVDGIRTAFVAKAVLKSAPATNVAVKRRVYGTKKELRIAVSLAAQGLQRFYAFILSYAPVLQQKSRICIRLFYCLSFIGA
jgi:hypothetical protein